MGKDEIIKQTNEWFMRNAEPPQDALKPIEAGRLKGKSDINPQWRIQALTEQYGICGVGWAYEIKEKEYVDVPATGEKMVFITVHLFIRDWNYPDEYKWIGNAIGIGGDFVIKKETNGLHANDEGLAMALTDAIGKAAKVFGIANNVYRGKFETKYEKQSERAKKKDEANSDYATEKQCSMIYGLAKKGNINIDKITTRYEVSKVEEMSKEQASHCIGILQKQVGQKR